MELRGVSVSDSTGSVSDAVRWTWRASPRGVLLTGRPSAFVDSLVGPVRHRLPWLLPELAASNWLVGAAANFDFRRSSDVTAPTSCESLGRAPNPTLYGLLSDAMRAIVLAFLID